jgi:hypothetical protein
MANLIDSYIRCTSNPELLMLLDPEKITENKVRSRFLRRNFDELVYEGRGITMHDALIILSKQFPKEVFLARYYFIDAFMKVPAECYQYQDGKVKYLGYEPVYKFSKHDHLLKAIGEEKMKILWFRIREYLFRLDHTKESLVDGENLYTDMLEDHFDNCVSSTVTIHAQMSNFRLSVDKITNAELILRGYTRGGENEEWVEILPESKEQEPE